MSDETERVPEEVGGAESATTKEPSLLSNYVSFAGWAVVAASLTSILLLFLIELTSSSDNPYLGILTYMLLPGVMFFGLGVVLLGALRERRRRRRNPGRAHARPLFDFSDPRRRRNFMGFVAAVFVF